MSVEEDIIQGTVGDVKKEIGKLDSVDYDALIKAEEKGKNRKTLIEWLELKKQESGEKVEEKAKPEKKKEEPEKKEKIKKEIPVEKIMFHERKKLSKDEERIYRIRFREKKAIPNFMRQELTKRKRLKAVWRKPKGEDSKQAEGKRGKPRNPGIGYKKKKETRRLHPSGFYPLRVHNVFEIEEIDPKKEAAIIAGSVGRRKRNEIIKVANKNKITILNPRRGEIQKK